MFITFINNLIASYINEFSIFFNIENFFYMNERSICILIGIACYLFFIIYGLIKLKKKIYFSIFTVLISVLFGYIGTKVIYFIFVNPNNITFNEVMFSNIFSYVDSIGMFFSFLGYFLVSFIFYKIIYKKGFIDSFDLLPYISVGLAFCLAFSKLGCFVNGCCYGDIIYFDDGRKMRIPIQLIEFITLLIIALSLTFIFFFLKKYRKYLIHFFIIFYFLSRGIEQFFRDVDYRLYVFYEIDRISVFSIIVVLIYLIGILVYIRFKISSSLNKIDKS